MEGSKGAVFGLGLSQCAITLGCVLFFPGVEVDVYAPHASLTGNHTHGSIALKSTAVRVHMGMPVLGASLLAAMFAVVTYKAHEQNLSGQDFQPDVLDQMGMWDLLFWAYGLLAHGIVILTLCDPVDVFGVIGSTTFMAHFLFRACYPKPQNVNLTQENLNILGYCLGLLMLVYQVRRPDGSSVIMVLVVLDYFLGIGHTYDRQATIDTVSNCRLFYVCAGTVGTAILYALSGSGGELAN